MTGAAVDIEVKGSPEDVWALLGDFGGLGDVMPGIESFRVEGDDRVIGMFGMEIREHLVERDEEARAITYSITDGVPVESHQATITVQPEGDNTRVVWAVEVTPAEMLPIFTDTYQKALEAVAARFA